MPPPPPAPHMHRRSGLVSAATRGRRMTGKVRRCPPPAHGVSVFLLNRDRTLDEVRAALCHEYKWAPSLCCARERSHKLWEGERRSLSASFCPEFHISSDSRHGTRAPRGPCTCSISTHICAPTRHRFLSASYKLVTCGAALPDSD